MSKIFALEATFAATIYIKAESLEEATKIANDKVFRCTADDLPTSSLRFADPRLPDVSISPAMTNIDEFEYTEDDLDEV